MDADADVSQIRERLRGIRTQVSRVLYRSLRWEGPSAKGAHNYNALIRVTDEAAYMKAIDELRALFDANGLKDAKINVWRVVVGQTDHTHRVVIATTSADRLAAMLEHTATPSMAAWFAKSANLRTVVSTSTSREITR
jgi:tagatose-1,6-bisphosphate aldolase non-catalytic subunit AgaZ/GatZ